MASIHSTDKLFEYFQRFMFFKSTTFFDKAEKFATFAVLHYEAHIFTHPKSWLDFDDVLVVDFRCTLSFRIHRCNIRSIPKSWGVDKLQGNFLIRTFMDSKHNPSESSPTQFFCNSVLREQACKVEKCPLRSIKDVIVFYYVDVLVEKLDSLFCEDSYYVSILSLEIMVLANLFLQTDERSLLIDIEVAFLHGVAVLANCYLLTSSKRLEKYDLLIPVVDYFLLYVHIWYCY